MRISPDIDTYKLERDGSLSDYFSAHPQWICQHITLSVWQQELPTLTHFQQLWCPFLWREISSWTFSSYFQMMNSISSGPFLYQTLNFLAPCNSHFKDQCKSHTPLGYHSPLSLPTSLAKAAPGFLHRSSHIWGQQPFLNQKWGQL